MSERERWQALQRHLLDARTAFDAGRTREALHHVDAALALDPAFLAAQSLKERILTAPAEAALRVAEMPVAASRRPIPLARPTRFPAGAADVAAAAVVASSDSRPLVSAEGLARFEARARQRRLDRRVEAARAAFTERSFVEARAALDEIREIAPADPRLAELTALVEAAQTERRAAPDSARHPARWIAAAAVFAAVLLGGSRWLENPGWLRSYPIAEVGRLAPDMAVATSGVAGFDSDPLVVDAADPDAADDSAGPVDTTPVPVAPPENDTPPPASTSSASRSDTAITRSNSGSLPAATPFSSALAATSATPSIVPRPPTPSPDIRELPPTPVTPATEPALTPAPPPAHAAAAATLAAVLPSRIDEEQLVKQTLQHYRLAYEDLDAGQARVVWPAVNEAALQRAFQGLESQRLAFDACDVQLRGPLATAVCRGSLTYVPKVGIRESRTEPRVWTFTLQKTGEAWQIQSARADR